MDEMSRTEREIPKTVIREQEEAHTEAKRANAIYDALIERRANWYQKYRPSLKSVPEVTSKKAARYRRQAVRLIEAAKKQGDFIKELREKGYKESTIKRWEKRIDLASQVAERKKEGELPLEKWRFGNLVKSLGETREKLEESKNLWSEKSEQFEKALGESMREGKTVDEAIREHAGLGEEKDKIGDELVSLRKHLKEVKEEIGARTYWNFWGIVEQKIYEEKPEGMTKENWEKRKEVERRILEEFRKALPKIEEKDPEAAAFMREKFQEREAAYQRMIEKEVAGKEAAPTVVTEEAPEIAPEPRRETRGEAVMPPPVEILETLPWEQWDIYRLAEELEKREREHSEIRLKLGIKQGQDLYEQKVKPLIDELNKRTHSAFSQVRVALGALERAKRITEPHERDSIYQDIRSYLKWAEEGKRNIPNLNSPEYRFTDELIRKAEFKYRGILKEEETRFDLGRMWKDLRGRFRFWLDLRVRERLAGRRKPVSVEEAEALEKRKAEQAQARKEALGRIWERTKMAVLPSANAVKGWVDRVWAKASAPFAKPLTKEEMDAALEAQKVEFKMPQIKEVSLKEVWKNADTKTRWAMGITTGVALTVGAGVVYCKISGTSGQEIYQAVSSGISSLSEWARELVARKPTSAELPTPVTEVAREATRGLIEKGKGLALGDLVQKAKTTVEVVKPPVEVAKETVKEVVVGKQWSPETMRQIIKEAWAAKKEIAEAAKPTVEFVAQKGDSLWELSKKAIGEGSLFPEETMKQYGNQILNAASRLEAAVRGGSLIKIGETVKLSPDFTKQIGQLVVDVNEAIKTTAPDIPVSEGGYGVAQKLLEAGKITKEQLEAFKLANGIDQAAALKYLKAFLGY